MVADPLPLLTSEVLAQMATFWTAFQEEPDSIRTVTRRAHLREVALPTRGQGGESSTWMTDMAELAARYPSVAAALKAAGLTAQQHDAYRVALISSKIQGVDRGAPLEATSVLAKNIAFREQHRDEFTALEKAGADPPKGAPRNHYSTGGALGIWRMP